MSLNVGLVYTDPSECPVSDLLDEDIRGVNFSRIPLNGTGLSGQDITRYDVLVFFTELDVLYGTDWVGRVLERSNAPGLLMMLPFRDVGRIKQLIHLGVQGFISPDCTREGIVRSIRIVARGKRYIDPAFSDTIVEHFLGSSET